MVDIDKIKKMVDEAYSHGSGTRERAADDLVFYYITHWEGAMIDNSQLAYRGEFDKLKKAVKQTGITEIAIAGGVSANSGLRNTLIKEAQENNWILHIPEFKYTTDNAAMIAITGYYKYLNNDFAEQSITPEARLKL